MATHVAGAARIRGVNLSRLGRSAAADTWYPALIGLAVLTLLVVGLSARPAVRHESAREPGRHIVDQTSLSSADINAAANQLLMSVKQWTSEDRDVSRFARAKIEWLTAEQKAGRLSVLLLESIAETNLDFEDLMAAGVVDGLHVIVIAQPRFTAFLTEGGRVSAPFSEQQRNDFMLGLVHEVVHLQRPNPGNPARFDDRLNEELRTWHEVDVNVVRQLRQLHQPMNESFLKADEAIRVCGDKMKCPALRELLLPIEARR
jgi:hypothetical protein